MSFEITGVISTWSILYLNVRPRHLSPSDWSSFRHLWTRAPAGYRNLPDKTCTTMIHKSKEAVQERIVALPHIRYRSIIECDSVPVLVMSGGRNAFPQWSKSSALTRYCRCNICRTTPIRHLEWLPPSSAHCQNVLPTVTTTSNQR